MFERLRCSWSGHVFKDAGERYLIGFTTAPFPAVDEYEQAQVCERCGARRAVFAGFQMEGDAA